MGADLETAIGELRRDLANPDRLEHLDKLFNMKDRVARLKQSEQPSKMTLATFKKMPLPEQHKFLFQRNGTLTE